MKKIIISLVFINFLFCNNLIAQVYYGASANKYVTNAEIVRIDENSTTPTYIKLLSGFEIDKIYLKRFINNTFKMPEKSGYKLIGTFKDKKGDIHYRYIMELNGIEVHDAQFIVHTRNSKIYAINGNINNNLNISNSVSVSKNEALMLALSNINANTYKWEIPGEERLIKEENDDPTATYYPKGELIIVPVKNQVNSNEHRIAYKFNIYAHDPLSRADYFIDAQSGELIFKLDQIQIADSLGTAVTKYSATVNIITDHFYGGFRLRESGRGNGIETKNMNTGTSYSSATDFTDSDNFWNNFNATKDEIATDAHWGMEMTYDYYYVKYNRNSIDNNGFKLRSYVHYDVNYANAFWDGLRMTFGDGNSSMNPLVSLDIVGHEISHGLITFTADLNYSYESGALNESFSDIFGTAIEFFAKPLSANWLLGEDVGNAMRSLSNPNSKGDPDTYLGNYWYTGSGDNGGVHTNSSVLNHWFYLASVGGSGTNDNNDSYSVTGIGIDSAAAVAYRMLTVYLTNTSQYADARFYAILAAIDLFGPCTPQVQTVTDAMYAVGIGGAYINGVHADFSADYTTFNTPPANVNFTNLSINGINFTWDFGDGFTSSSLHPSHTYNTYGVFNVKLLALGGTCGSDTIIKNTYIDIDPSNPVIVFIPPSGTSTVTDCVGKLFDDGGASNYHDNVDATTIINPAGATNITLTFLSFNFESGYDYLYIYDGPNTSSTLIGTYDGNTLPNGGTIVSTGSSITLRQETDGGVTESGFELNWACTYPPLPPIPDFWFSDSTSCNGEIQFTDNSIYGPISWLWDFGDGNTSTFKNPIHQYNTNGTFTITLIVTNSYGSDTIIKANIITINKPMAAACNSVALCHADSVTFTATGTGSFYWYDSLTGGNILDTGLIFTTPFLTSTATYYIENSIPTNPIFGAKPDNTGGGGFFTNYGQHYLVFDCNTDVVLKSVKVYAGDSKNRTIELRNNIGTVLQSKTVNIPSGQSRVTLDFDIPVGTDLELGGPSSPNLYRNNGGLNYPYSVGSIISIKHSSANSNPTGYYYYFYDWEVVEPPCKSERVAVTAFIHYDEPTAVFSLINNDPTIELTDASVHPAFHHWDFGDGNFSNIANTTYTYSANGTYNVKLKVTNGCGSDSTTQQVSISTTSVEESTNIDEFSVFPNPTNGKLTLKINIDKTQRIMINIVDMLGQTLWFKEAELQPGVFTTDLDLSIYSKGMYFINIVTNKGNVIKKVIHQ